MILDAWIAAAIVCTAIVLVTIGRYSPHVVLLGALTVALGMGVVEPSTALGGFADPDLFTIAALSVVLEGLGETGALGRAFAWEHMVETVSVRSAAGAARERHAERRFIEAVVSRRSSLVGRTLRDALFASRYGAIAVAISRGGERTVERLEEVVLRPGDVLLLDAVPACTRDFDLVAALDGVAPGSSARAPAALSIAALGAASVALGLLGLLEASLLAAVLMILTRCCSEAGLRRRIEWRALVAAGAALGLAGTLQETAVLRTVFPVPEGVVRALVIALAVVGLGLLHARAIRRRVLRGHFQAARSLAPSRTR